MSRILYIYLISRLQSISSKSVLVEIQRAADENKGAILLCRGDCRFQVIAIFSRDTSRLCRLAKLCGTHSAFVILYRGEDELCPAVIEHMKRGHEILIPHTCENDCPVCIRKISLHGCCECSYSVRIVRSVIDFRGIFADYLKPRRIFRF